MFDLEQAIADWRSRMRAGGIKTPATLDELENHLREDIGQQTPLHADPREAFETAVRNIGQPGALKSEFAMAGGAIQERIKHLILTLAGIPEPQLATNMNTSSSNPTIDPGWATYFKGTAFVMPALLLWFVSVIFILPKVAWLCQSEGMTVFGFEGAPAAIRDFATIGSAMVFLSVHGILAAGIVILALVLLEWRANRWPRYRRAAVGTGIFLFNFAVIVSITLMLIDMVIVMPSLMHHAK